MTYHFFYFYLLIQLVTPSDLFGHINALFINFETLQVIDLNKLKNDQ